MATYNTKPNYILNYVSVRFPSQGQIQIIVKEQETQSQVQLEALDKFCLFYFLFYLTTLQNYC